jgi:NAD(P)-dependent dehydrogenase (short-subunit alcohol dehydrogenase family)
VRVAVSSRVLVELPDAVTAATAAALPLAGLTGVRLVRAAGPLIGRRLLITGASGGVGHYVTELTVAAGAEVTAVSASAEGARRSRRSGGGRRERRGRSARPLRRRPGVGRRRIARRCPAQGQDRRLVLWFGQASRTPATVDFFDWIDGTAGAPIVAFQYERGDFADERDLAILVRLTAAGRLHPEIGTLLPWQHTPGVIEAIGAPAARQRHSHPQPPRG